MNDGTKNSITFFQSLERLFQLSLLLSTISRMKKATAVEINLIKECMRWSYFSLQKTLSTFEKLSGVYQEMERCMSFLSVTVHQSHSNQAPMNQPQVYQTQTNQPKPVIWSSNSWKGPANIVPSKFAPKATVAITAIRCFQTRLAGIARFATIRTNMLQKHSLPSLVVDFASLAAQLVVQTREHTKSTFSRTQCALPAT